jgi:cell division protein FtsW (lipid II flippase)
MRTLVAARTGPAPASSSEEADDPDKPVSLLRPVLVIGAMAIYVLALDVAGYLLATSVLLFVVHLIFGVRKRWWLALIVSMAFTVALYLFFGELLLVPLPAGSWIA